MIVGVGGELLCERRQIADAGGLLGQMQRAAQAAAIAGSGSLPGAVGGAIDSTALGLVEIAGLDMQPGEAADRLRVGLVLG